MKKISSNSARKQSASMIVPYEAAEACYGVVPDDEVAALMTCLLGSNIQTVVSDFATLDASERKEIILIALGAAIGGTRVVDGLAGRNLVKRMEGTCFAIDRKLNTSALVMAGHYLIKLEVNPRISAAFAKKYNASDVWEMKPEYYSEVGQDVRIKLEFAAKHSYNEQSGLQLAKLVAEAYGKSVPSHTAQTLGKLHVISPTLPTEADMIDVESGTSGTAAGASSAMKEYPLRSKASGSGTL